MNSDHIPRMSDEILSKLHISSFLRGLATSLGEPHAKALKSTAYELERREKELRFADGPIIAHNAKNVIEDMLYAPPSVEESAKIAKQKDDAYHERNMLVCALSKLFPAWLGRHPDNEEWDADWRTIVFIELPTGQVSWHIQDVEQRLFTHLKPGPGKWDGHTTWQKYDRLANLRGEFLRAQGQSPLSPLLAVVMEREKEIEKLRKAYEAAASDLSQSVALFDRWVPRTPRSNTFKDRVAELDRYLGTLQKREQLAKAAQAKSERALDDIAAAEPRTSNGLLAWGSKIRGILAQTGR